MKQKKKVKSRRRSIHTGDITREIAMARAAGRVHGPFMTTCSACGRRYWPDKKEEHLEVCGKPAVQPLPLRVVAGQKPVLKTHSPERPTQSKPRPVAAGSRSRRPAPSQPSLPRMRICPDCGTFSADMSRHMKESHGLIFHICPHCRAESTATSPGPVNCRVCRRSSLAC